MDDTSQTNLSAEESSKHNNDRSTVQSFSESQSASRKRSDTSGTSEHQLGVDDDLSQDLDNMQDIRKSFSTVINEFQGEGSAGKLLEEYTKLYEALKDSHRLQRIYLQEVSNLRSDIKNNAEKVNLAVHLSQEDKEIINVLTSQVSHAWNEVEVLSTRESKAETVIRRLQTEINSLTSLVEAGSGIHELRLVAEQAINERKELHDALQTLREEIEFKELKNQEATERMQAKDKTFLKDLAKINDKLLDSEKKRSETQQKLDQMEEQCKYLEMIRNNLTMENKNNMAELDSHKAKIVKLDKEESDLKEEIVNINGLNSSLQETMSEKMKENHKVTIENENLKKRLAFLQVSGETQKRKIDEKSKDLNICDRTVKKKMAEIDSLLQKCKHASAQLRTLHVQLLDKEKEVSEEKDNMNVLRTILNENKGKMHSFMRALKDQQRVNEKEKRVVLKLTNQKTALGKVVQLKDCANSNLKRQMIDMSKQLNEAINTADSLDSDKRRLYRRINQILELVNDLANDNDHKVNKLMFLMRIGNQQEDQIHKTNGNLVQMTNQRNNLGNELHLVQLVNDELKIANLNFSRQTDALSDNLQAKEQELTNLYQKNQHLLGELNSLHNEIGSLGEENKEKDGKIMEFEGMVMHMDKLLCSKTRKIEDLNDTIDQVVTQRNILAYQCNNKKEHIKLLMEKINVMQMIFKVGNQSYYHQRRVMGQMKIQIISLYRQKKCLIGKAENLEDYKSKLGLANQQLVRALAKIRAVEGERPYNLHQWRHIKAVDVSKYEMTLKIHHLLQRSILKTDEVTRLQNVILEKTTVMSEMKRILDRRPGPEIIEKARQDREEKENLSKKLKAALAEKNLCVCKCDRQVAHNKNLISRYMEEQKKSIQLKKANIKLVSKVTKLPSINDPLKKKALPWNILS